MNGKLNHPSGCVVKFQITDIPLSNDVLYRGRFYAPHDIDRGQTISTPNFSTLVEWFRKQIDNE